MSIFFLPITVVIPCFNCSSTIERVFHSVVMQVSPPAEIILIDDASSDDTLACLHALKEQYEGVVLVKSLERNSGPGVARNFGWELSTQPWISFLDSDDIWHPEKLKIQYSWLLDHPDVSICGHDSALLINQEFLEYSYKAYSFNKYNLCKFLISNRLATRSVMLRANLPFRFRGGDYAEDYLLWLTIVANGFSVYKLDICLAFSLRPEYSPGGYSGEIWRHEVRELYSLHALYLDRKISMCSLILASMFSMIKFSRRWFLTKFNYV